MQDPFAWSFPFGRLFGVTIRIHVLFPFVAVVLILRAACDKDLPPGVWLDATLIIVVLFLSVLLHEFGHCFGARAVNGDAHEVLLWPLGGLAAVDVPHTPRANFITTVCGPAVNVVLAVGALFLLWATANVKPHFGLPSPGRDGAGLVTLPLWGGGEEKFSSLGVTVLLHQLWRINYFLFLLNVLLPAFPLDGGRMVQSIAWKYVGYRRATLLAIYLGFIVMFVVAIFA